MEQLKEFLMIPFNHKILKIELINENQLKLIFSNTNNYLLFTISDFTSIEKIPFSTTPFKSYELILNLKDLINPFIENILTNLFSELIIPPEKKRSVISLTYKNTYFFIRTHNYSFKTLNKISLRNSGPHFTLRLNQLTFNGKKYNISYPNDKLKGNNIGKRYHQKTILINKNGNRRTIIKKEPPCIIVNNSPIVIEEL